MYLYIAFSYCNSTALSSWETTAIHASLIYKEEIYSESLKTICTVGLRGKKEKYIFRGRKGNKWICLFLWI